jgi:hypothetical protein
MVNGGSRPDRLENGLHTIHRFYLLTELRTCVEYGLWTYQRQHVAVLAVFASALPSGRQSCRLQRQAFHVITFDAKCAPGSRIQESG